MAQWACVSRRRRASASSTVCRRPRSIGKPINESKQSQPIHNNQTRPIKHTHLNAPTHTHIHTHPRPTRLVDGEAGGVEGDERVAVRPALGRLVQDAGVPEQEHLRVGCVEWLGGWVVGLKGGGGEEEEITQTPPHTPTQTPPHTNPMSKSPNTHTHTHTHTHTPYHHPP
jgi:hypothetical protein